MTMSSKALERPTGTWEQLKQRLAAMYTKQGGTPQQPQTTSTGMNFQRVGPPQMPKITPAELESHGITKRFQGVTFEALVARGIPRSLEPGWKAVQEYRSQLKAATDEGMGLILTGNVGTGKTTLAVAILRELLETSTRRSGQIIPMISLIDNLVTMQRMDKTEAAEYEQRIRRCELLVLDDLGGENTTQPWVQAKVDSIITERYNRMKSIIVTTNLDPDALTKIYGGRIVDRLRSTCRVIRFSGQSLR